MDTNSNATTAPFDLESVYDTEIYPLMEKVIEICRREGMPMMALFCYAKAPATAAGTGERYCATLLPRGDWQAPEIAHASRRTTKAVIMPQVVRTADSIQKATA